MEDNPFANNELCDGKCCVIRCDCARYMGNVEISRCNPYVVFNRKPWPEYCPHYLPQPSDKYPHKNDTCN